MRGLHSIIRRCSPRRITCTVSRVSIYQASLWVSEGVLQALPRLQGQPTAAALLTALAAAWSRHEVMTEQLKCVFTNIDRYATVGFIHFAAQFEEVASSMVGTYLHVSRDIARLSSSPVHLLATGMEIAGMPAVLYVMQ